MREKLCISNKNFLIILYNLSSSNFFNSERSLHRKSCYEKGVISSLFS